MCQRGSSEDPAPFPSAPPLQPQTNNAHARSLRRPTSAPPAFPAQALSLKSTMHMRIRQQPVSRLAFLYTPLPSNPECACAMVRTPSTALSQHKPFSRSAVPFGPAPSPTSFLLKLSQFGGPGPSPTHTHPKSTLWPCPALFHNTPPPTRGKAHLGSAPSLVHPLLKSRMEPVIPF